jgi:hypothetical protein
MVDSAKHTFLAWVQPGVVAGFPDQAVDRLAPTQPAAISLPVKLVVNTTAVEKTVRLYGPSDVTAIDPQQIIRLEPKSQTTDFEPNYFPAIEFDRPDFPWLFTPAKADSLGRLRPWVCLVVVRKQEGVQLRSAALLPLPVLEIKAPARPADELPDLSESHFWAHAQITGAAPGQLQSVLDSSPTQTASRLLCPRRLDPLTEYIACVVPAFEVGRKAGLNEPTDAQTLQPSWLSGSQAPAEITLPVYYAWEFRTAAGGDFEELVRRLEPRELPPQVGKRPMDISAPGFPLKPQPPPDAEGTIIGLEGALRIADSKSDPWPDAVRDPFQAGLAEIVNTPGEVAANPRSNQDPILAPPIYGSWQAASRRVEPKPPATAADNFAFHRIGPLPPVTVDDGSPPPWLNELNLDPRNRAIAAMGTQVVQRQQEALMASAWAQLGDIEKINQRLRQAQLSRSVNEKYHAKTFHQFSDEALTRIVAPAQSRLMLPAQPNQPAQLLVQRLAQSPVPVTAVSAPVRKLARPRGAFSRQFSQTGVPARGLFTVFNGIMAPPFSAERAAVTVDQVSQMLAGAIGHEIIRDHRGPFGGGVVVSERFTVLMPGTNQRQTASEGVTGLPSLFTATSLHDNVISQRPPAPNTTPEFMSAVHAHQEYLTTLFTTFIFMRSFVAVVTTDLKAAVLTGLDPAQTVGRQARSDLNIKSPALLSGDELDTIMDAPVFPQPMYEALRDLSQDYFFPGLEHVLPNSIQLLETNAKFIESFMVGLNTEMGRELLWRNYPTDQRGTYFKRFWGTVAADGKTPVDDIAPIHEWKQGDLGSIAAGGDNLVLLIRGELLRRYPGTIIYAVKAVVHEGRRELATDHPEMRFNPAERIERHPVFRGSLEPDVTFVGFDLTPAEVLKDDGWFFILQQQPTEPRFGLDDAEFGDAGAAKIPELKTWNDLNWAHLAPTAPELKLLSHVPVKETQLLPTDPDKGTWGRNAAHMAYITKQLPVRIAIHATEFLPDQPPKA